MNPKSLSISNLSIFSNTLLFLKKHFLIILALGLVAAFGRVIQLGGLGSIPKWANIALEVIIEFSRLVIVLFVLGMTNIKRGGTFVREVITSWRKMKACLRVAVSRFKTHWVTVSLNLLVFMSTVFIINFMIDQLAYETCLLISLKDNGILSEKSSEWSILLFFKNLTVIPFTLVFESILLLWMLNFTPRLDVRRFIESGRY
jgi:hypothetical protein